MKISKSYLMSYDSESKYGCPYKFYLTYVKGYTFKPTSAMRLGTIFHDHAKLLYDRLDVKQLDGRSRIEVCRLIQSLLPKNDVFLNFAKYEADRYSVLGPKFIPYKREHTVFNDTKKGIIDRVFKVDNGFMVEELKRATRRSYPLEDVKFEVGFYANLLLEKGMNVTLGSCFFAQDGQLAIFDIDERCIAKVKEREERILKGIADENFEPCWDSRCNYCPKEIRDKCLEGKFNGTNGSIEGISD
jgi:hypothetical protein